MYFNGSTYISTLILTLAVITMVAFCQQVRKNPMCTQELIFHGSVKKATIASSLALIYAEDSQLFVKDCQI